MNVLIIEDNRSYSFLVQILLKSNGYAVSAAYNGKTALEEIAGNIPDLIILDVNLPDISGFELCERIKSRDDTRTVPLIFLTGHKEAAITEKGIALGAAEVLVKPVDHRKLLEVVSECLGRKDVKKKLKQKT